MSPLNEKYWLTRIVFIRCLAFMYAVAFLVALKQNESLIGEHGLTPAVLYVAQRPADTSTLQMLLSHPTLFWIVEPTTKNLEAFASTGLIISLIILYRGSANIPLLFSLWSLYFSIVSVGQRWYSFGWESQLLETGFLAMFMVPVFSLKQFPALTPTPWVATWGYRWLLFRIMIGAGAIKLRGDQCWRDLTCMNYHYQTQPVPNMFSIYFHHNFDWVHTAETMGNHVVELALPILLLFPHRYLRFAGGAVQILFQMVLILSGNLAFLNWLTALPAVMCFDDAVLSVLFSQKQVDKAIQAEDNYSKTLQIMSEPSTSSLSWSKVSIYTRRTVTLLIAGLICVLSYPVVKNVLSPSQGMNVSFEPFRIVNSYGAFGSVTKVRHEVILQGTSDKTLTHNTVWKDFEFACKPGNINRRPCWISPYHLRIDWLMWFAAFQNYQHCPWVVHLADKLLHNDPVTAQLLAPGGNPFLTTGTGVAGDSDNHIRNAGEKNGVKSADKSGSTAPSLRFVRAELYEYQYPSLDAAENEAAAAAGWEVGKWWKRRHVTNYMPAVEPNNESVRRFLHGNRLIK